MFLDHFVLSTPLEGGVGEGQDNAYITGEHKQEDNVHLQLEANWTE